MTKTIIIIFAVLFCGCNQKEKLIELAREQGKLTQELAIVRLGYDIDWNRVDSACTKIQADLDKRVP